MTKKQLYFIIAGLCAVLLFVLFIPTEKSKEVQVAATQQEVDIQAEDENVATESGTQEPVVTDEEKEAEPMVLEGVFIGLLDGENAYQKKFKYLLLNDGVEVLRIDLRPLVGYSDISIIEKLGVNRGDQIRATGMVHDGEFTVETIEDK
jgi:hypothetical protein